jgi:glycosyltransferase involved in cell wall biosynthesis
MASGANWIDFDEFKRRFLKVPVEEYPNQVVEQGPAPLVTVHIVTYNHRDFIRDAIEGVLMQQTDFPFEIIIGDDESTDGTREICLEYARRYPGLIRLMLHKRENNIAVLGKPCLIFQYLYNSFSARGEYIAVCSGDDYWTDPLKLQKQVQVLRQNPTVNRTHSAHKIQYLGDRKGEDELGEGAASTWMVENVFTEIPVQFTQVIAEDSFLDFFLAAHGDRMLTEGLSPVVIRRHGANMFMTDDEREMEIQRVNTIENCIAAFRIYKEDNMFSKKLVGKLLDKNKKRANLYGYGIFKTIYYTAKDFLRHGLVYQLAKNYILPKFCSTIGIKA